jgi:hypothetical protein
VKRADLVVDSWFLVGFKDLNHTLSSLHGHGALLDDDFVAIGGLSNHAGSGFNVLQVGSSALQLWNALLVLHN